jgi:hypothetical protein
MQSGGMLDREQGLFHARDTGVETLLVPVAPCGQELRRGVQRLLAAGERSHLVRELESILEHGQDLVRDHFRFLVRVQRGDAPERERGHEREQEQVRVRGSQTVHVASLTPLRARR